jgi:cellulose synthase/poly-beta-1,6-N-acetylglucosamine synthase-like glycosyltransferase
MVALISFFLATLALLLAVPVAALFVEVVAAIVMPERECLVQACEDSRRRVTVLVPAHNESTGLLPTLTDIKAQLGATDRLLVIADNCTDDTAAVAAAAGADVISRIDPDKKGKGHALAAGLLHLVTDPPDVVIIVDADCRLADAAIDQLTSVCTLTHRPVQLGYLMLAPADSPINFRVAEFAWRVKNWVRPLGLKNLGLPCQLMGSGMAFPWRVIRLADLANGSIVEDLKLGLDLALAGTPAVFCPFPGVTSDFPFTIQGVQSQRLRWEQGYIRTILATTPRLICAAVARANLDLLALALDLSIPPLSLLGILVVGMLGLSSLATLLGSSSAMSISMVNLTAFICAVFISWLKFGRDVLPPGAFPLVASYVIAKLPIYRQLFLRRAGSQWIRTDRRKP